MCLKYLCPYEIAMMVICLSNVPYDLSIVCCSYCRKMFINLLIHIGKWHKVNDLLPAQDIARFLLKLCTLKRIVKYHFILKKFDVGFRAASVLFLVPCIYDIVLQEVPVWNLLLYILCSVCTCSECIKKYIISQLLLFIILQVNMDVIKVEKDVDVLSEEDSVSTKADDIYLPSTFSVEKVEPEVSLGFRWFLWLFVSVYVPWIYLKYR